MRIVAPILPRFHDDSIIELLCRVRGRIATIMRRLSSICALSILGVALGGDDFEQPPISYHEAESNDAVACLKRKLDAGEVKLEPDENGSYLRDLLRQLEVPTSSQCLVFSKTSLQINYIGPRTPRAIYFSDSVYVGFVQGSNIMELTAIDPQLGSVFYTLEIPSDKSTEESSQGIEKPTIIRDRGQCLSCHATTRTERVPGVLVRSIYPDRAGRPRSGASSYVTDHRSPFIKRWGGWFVTGTHGTMRHLGNAYATNRLDPQQVDLELGANRESLENLVDLGPYLKPTSDIVALMVLEHQTRMHNLITRANYETRQAVHLDMAMNQALGREGDFVSDSTKRRIAAVGDELIKGLLFGEEYPLESSVSSTGDFRADFERIGPCDAGGRSLRQLDLQTKLFRYPCSYLILSDHFDGLPPSVMNYIRDRMKSILLENAEVPAGVELSPSDKTSIAAMLETFKPNWLP